MGRILHFLFLNKKYPISGIASLTEFFIGIQTDYLSIYSAKKVVCLKIQLNLIKFVNNWLSAIKIFVIFEKKIKFQPWIRLWEKNQALLNLML